MPRERMVRERRDERVVVHFTKSEVGKIEKFLKKNMKYRDRSDLVRSAVMNEIKANIF